MSEPPSFSRRLVGGAGSSSLSPRQQRPMRSLLDRTYRGAVPLEQARQEAYVRRNLSRDEARPPMTQPEFVRAARERLGESFRSEEFRI